MTHHTTQRRAKLRPLPAHGVVPGGALPPLVPYHARLAAWLRFLHETACTDQAWKFSTGKTDSAIQSVSPKISTRWRVDFFLSVFPGRKNGKTDCLVRNGNLPDIGFCDLSIGKTDCLRNGLRTRKKAFLFTKTAG